MWYQVVSVACQQAPDLSLGWTIASRAVTTAPEVHSRAGTRPTSTATNTTRHPIPCEIRTPTLPLQQIVAPTCIVAHYL